MATNIPCYGGSTTGAFSATAGTVYYGLIPPRLDGFTRIVGLEYTCSTTVNPFTIMRPIGWANITQAQTTSDSTVTLDVDPSPTGNTIAAGDQVVLGPCTDGTYRRAQVNTSGWNSTTKVLTFTGTLPAAVNTSTKFFMLGVSGDTDPNTGVAFPAWNPTASTTATKEFLVPYRTHRRGDPFLIYCPNATAATNLNQVYHASSAL